MAYVQQSVARRTHRSVSATASRACCTDSIENAHNEPLCERGSARKCSPAPLVANGLRFKTCDEGTTELLTLCGSLMWATGLLSMVLAQNTASSDAPVDSSCTYDSR